MTSFTFAPATREQAKARIGLQGPAGSGKTKSALRIAEGLAKGGLIGVVDTERGSAKKYAPVPGRPDLGGHVFGHMPMDTHDPRNLVQAVAAAEAAGIEVLIVDSWSPFWNGRGGLLEIVENAGSAKGSGGTFGGWRTGNPIEQQMLDALLNFRGHLIVTMRTKGDYVIEGKKVTKVGVKAIQRDGTEYELDVVMDMVEGTATVTKTRYEPLTDLVVHHPGEDIGELILDQLGQGVDPVDAVLAELTAEGLTYEGALAIYGRAEHRRLLGLEAAHPVTGEVMPLGEVIKAVGTALKTAPTGPSPSPARQALEEHADELAGSADQSAEVERPASSGAVTAPMMRKVFAQLKAVGCPEQRDKRLYTVGLLLGRPVDSMNELTRDDGAELIDTLSGFEGEDGRERFAQTIARLADQFGTAA